VFLFLATTQDQRKRIGFSLMDVGVVLLGQKRQELLTYCRLSY